MSCEDKVIKEFLYCWKTRNDNVMKKTNREFARLWLRELRRIRQKREASDYGNVFN